MQTLRMEFYCNIKEAEIIMQEYLSQKIKGKNRFKLKKEDNYFGKIYSFGLEIKAPFGTRYANYYYDKNGKKVSTFGFGLIKIHGTDIAFKNVELLSEIAYKIDDDKITIFFRYDQKFYTNDMYKKRYNIYDLHEELIDKLNKISKNNEKEKNKITIEERINGDEYGTIRVYYDEIKNKTGIFQYIK